MAIEGLRSPDAPATAAVEVNISGRAELAFEALRLLDRLGEDPDATLESVKTDFDQLTQATDSVGETYVQLPFGNGFTPENMLRTIDGTRYPGDRTYPVTFPLEQNAKDISRRLWFPQDSRREGYSIDEINRLDVVQEGEDEPAVRPAHARLALADGPESQEPLLHLLDLPYDEKYAKRDQNTQLKQMAVLQAELKDATPELELNAINLAGFAMLALQRRIEGKPMPMSWGFMRIPQLGRKTVDRGSWVGRVHSDGVRLRLDGTVGVSDSYGGVGLSVGLKELDPQAS